MQRRVLLLLTALIVAAMMSVGPAFAHGGHDCNRDWRWWHNNRSDCDDGGGVNIGHITYKATTAPWR